MKTLKAIRSLSELETQLKASETVYLLLYKKGTEASDCAYTNIRNAAEKVSAITLLCADVSDVRDIHPQYGIESVPNLLIFENGDLKNIVKGCNENAHYSNIFEHVNISKGTSEENKKPQKRVTVYSTPSCSWCATLKNYLKEHNIFFRDVDVSRDMKAAEDIVKRSGQRGVPQTDINGQMIVGFDKARINQLLEIKA
ncbi:MAG: NrdH-redoxin [Candidatus Neomarinimicrobiota bacterium]|nr:MAG: NrdH-redoxin [Candidatus Neomarinimicrobiota bacterium]